MIASKILNFIKENPDNWEELINAKDIATKHKGDLVCFKYNSIMSDFSDPIVCESRGIIIDVKNLKVVCWPFDKFFNVQEQYAADIDWSSARVLEKIDGSLIKLYYYNGEWVFATSSTCDAHDANVDRFGKKYYDIIKKAVNYNKIPFDTLDPDYTYMFELVSPESQVVINYKSTALYFLACRNNTTGEEIETSIGIMKPNSYPLNSLEGCMEAVEKLNMGSDVTNEGFVVVDKNYHRVKIKSMAYVSLHHIKNAGFTAKRMSELYAASIDFDELVKEFPGYTREIRFYQWQIAEFEFNVEQMIDYARSLYEEYDHDRKAVALAVKKSKYSYFGFKAIDNELTAEEMISALRPSQIEGYLKDYEYEEKVVVS